jgi:hypothetical protein
VCHPENRGFPFFAIALGGTITNHGSFKGLSAQLGLRTMIRSASNSFRTNNATAATWLRIVLVFADADLPTVDKTHYFEFWLCQLPFVVPI